MIEYNFLGPILNDRDLHAKFLNTLSFLEYIGARKIFKGRDEGSVDFETLLHMSEEVRHALLFKRLSMKVSPKKMGYNREGVFCYEIARSYIGKLDQYCEQLVSKDDCYALVSYVIEQRAVSFYRHYSGELEKRGKGFSLKSLLAEEERHLVEMEEKIRSHIPSDIVQGALDFEGKLFTEFTDALNRSLSGDYDLGLFSPSVSSKSGEMSISMMEMSSSTSTVSKDSSSVGCSP